MAMALEVVRPHTRQASTRSPHSSSVGWRLVTTVQSARGTTNSSMSCTSTLEPRLRSWRTAFSGAGPDNRRVALRRAVSFSSAAGS